MQDCKNGTGKCLTVKLVLMTKNGTHPIYHRMRESYIGNRFHDTRTAIAWRSFHSIFFFIKQKPYMISFGHLHFWNWKFPRLLPQSTKTSQIEVRLNGYKNMKGIKSNINRKQVLSLSIHELCYAFARPHSTPTHAVAGYCSISFSLFLQS